MENLPFSFELRDGRLCTVRRSTEDDAAELCAFMPQALAESDFLERFPDEFNLSVEEEKAWLRQVGERDDAMGLVAEVDGRIIATGGAQSSKFRRDAHHAYIGVIVRKAFWGQGVGRRLLEFLLDWGQSRGLRKMYLIKVFDDNTRAIRLYKSLGFIEEGRLRGDVLRADGRYSDTITMAKYFVA